MFFIAFFLLSNFTNLKRNIKECVKKKKKFQFLFVRKKLKLDLAIEEDKAEAARTGFNREKVRWYWLV